MPRPSLRHRTESALRRFAEAIAAVMSSAWTSVGLLAFCGLQLLGPKWAEGVLYVSNDIQLLLIPLLGLSSAIQFAKLLRLLRQILANQRMILGRLTSVEAQMTRSWVSTIEVR